MLKGFREFVLRGNVLDLAVAVIMGAAFNQVVNSLVGDVLTPSIAAVVGTPDYSAIKIGPIAAGNFINAVVNFLIVAAALYFFVVAPSNAFKKREKPQPEPSEPVVTEEVRLLREIAETLKNK